MSDRMIINNGQEMFVSGAIGIGPDGKPTFRGREDLSPNPAKKQEGSKMTCPVCGKQVDYLVGITDTQTGEQQGCEGCYKPPAKLPLKGGEANGQSSRFRTQNPSPAEGPDGNQSASQPASPKEIVFD